MHSTPANSKKKKGKEKLHLVQLKCDPWLIGMMAVEKNLFCFLTQ